MFCLVCKNLRTKGGKNSGGKGDNGPYGWEKALIEGGYKMFQPKPEEEQNCEPISDNRHVHGFFSFIEIDFWIYRQH